MSAVEEKPRPSQGRIAVLMGGNSAEREISLLSGNAVLRALLSKGVDAIGIDVDEHLATRLLSERFDKVFNMLHGRGGEDGTLQGMLEMMGISYTGSGVLASALAMDKVKTKQIWQCSGLSTPNFCVLDDTTDFDALVAQMNEVVVKPAHEGSSLGMSMASDGKSVRQAYEKARAYDMQVMAEQRIRGAEFTVPFIHGQVFPAIELRTGHEFFDFDAKYIASDTQYLCPAPLSAEKTEELTQLCRKAFDVIGVREWGRADVMQDKAGKFWLLEVNTVPGMTDHSLIPLSAAAMGLSFADLVLLILDGGQR
jgi:D-alanine-D-alanine ligase